MKTETYTVTENDSGRRMDRIIRVLKPDWPLSRVFKALRSGDIRLNAGKCPPEAKAFSGDTITIRSGDQSGGKAPRDAKLKTPSADAASLLVMPEIVFENPHLLIVNKPRGMLVHDGERSLDKIVNSYLEGRIAPSLSFKPGPLHRLDRNTSGLVSFSKSLSGAKEFSLLLAERKIGKTYLALMDGTLEKAERWQDELTRDDESRMSEVTGAAGKTAVTNVRPLATADGMTLSLVTIETGLTHQIRAQAEAHGHPLSGDRKYGGGEREGGYFLHALRLEFPEGTECGFPREATALPDKVTQKRITELFGDKRLQEILKIDPA